MLYTYNGTTTYFVTETLIFFKSIRMNQGNKDKSSQRFPLPHSIHIQFPDLFAATTGSGGLFSRKGAKKKLKEIKPPPPAPLAAAPSLHLGR